MPRPPRPTSPKPAASNKSAALNVGGAGGNGGRVTKSTPQKARRIYTDNEMIEAIYKHNGLIVRIADALDCSRNAIYERCAIKPAVQEALDKARLFAIDTAEDALHKRITDGDTTAIIFLLKTLGKFRGYVERQEVTGANGKDLMSFADLARMVKESQGE